MHGLNYCKQQAEEKHMLWAKGFRKRNVRRTKIHDASIKIHNVRNEAWNTSRRKSMRHNNNKESVKVLSPNPVRHPVPAFCKPKQKWEFCMQTRRDWLPNRRTFSVQLAESLRHWKQRARVPNTVNDLFGPLEITDTLSN